MNVLKITCAVLICVACFTAGYHVRELIYEKDISDTEESEGDEKTFAVSTDASPNTVIRETSSLQEVGERTTRTIVTDYTKPDLAEFSKKNRQDIIMEEVIDGEDEDEEELDEYEEDEECEEDEFDWEDPGTHCRAISEREFESQRFRNLPVCQETLYFYTKDNIMCNESDEVIGEEEYSYLIGDTDPAKFAARGVLYIRNRNLGTDYQILVLPLSYSAEILGVVETDKEKETRRELRKSRFGRV